MVVVAWRGLRAVVVAPGGTVAAAVEEEGVGEGRGEREGELGRAGSWRRRTTPPLRGSLVARVGGHETLHPKIPRLQSLKPRSNRTKKPEDLEPSQNSKPHILNRVM